MPSAPLRSESTRTESIGTAASLRGVNFFYGLNQVLFDVNLEVPARGILAFIGPSGCGKSTLLRTMNRMNDLLPGARLTGEVRIGQEDIYRPGTDVISLRRRVGMVFQRSNPFPFSIADNVAYGIKINRLARDRAQRDAIIERSLRSAGLWDEVKDRLHRPALSLSGGQQQRLCIARALAVEPDILLMDEPASALDPIATARIEELAIELKERFTIVIVTHNLQQAARVSDRTSFFLMGKLIETGKTRQIFSKPARKETEDYITGRFG
ncbi:MAG TPA: phosphate ABC transporter ATP-binding protein PstB [Terriglobales bacterium]|nr:phosphate ABC transporter ATP-binding protein PstB [Terriglobales bacterium]